MVENARMRRAVPVMSCAVVLTLGGGGCYEGIDPAAGTETDALDDGGSGGPGGDGGVDGADDDGPVSGASGASGGSGASADEGTGDAGSDGGSFDSGDPTAGPTGDAGDGDDSTGGPTADTGGDDAGATEAQQMCDRWTSDRADMSEGTWSGSVGACDPGDISATGRDNALRMLNLYRWLADLPEVTDDAGRNAGAQACALIMDANNALSHDPPMSWTCWSAAGDGAAGQSNISTGPGVMSVDMYMVDFGNETTLGHRRWILSNSIGPVGLGSTSGSSCMSVIGGSGNAGAQWTAYPPPGPFPFEAVTPLPFGDDLDETGWSIQSDSLDLSGAEVTITQGGEPRPVSITVLGSGYGSASAISMIPQGWGAQPGATYHVEVAGVGAAISYDVTFVDC